MVVRQTPTQYFNASGGGSTDKLIIFGIVAVVGMVIVAAIFLGRK